MLEGQRNQSLILLQILSEINFKISLVFSSCELGAQKQEQEARANSDLHSKQPEHRVKKNPKNFGKFKGISFRQPNPRVAVRVTEDRWPSQLNASRLPENGRIEMKPAAG